MRSPYETESAIDEAAIGRWNERNQRAIDEYALYQFADRRLGPKFDRRKGEGCPITCWESRPAGSRSRSDYDDIFVYERRCGEPVDSDDLCAKHDADRERLS